MNPLLARLRPSIVGPIALERTFLVFVLMVTACSMPARANAALCDSCLTVVDNCCGKLPQIVDPGYTPPTRGLVETRSPNPSAGNFCVTLYDITQNLPVEEDVTWNTIGRYHGPGGTWNVTNLGTVFGVTLDKYGNAYVCHTSCYASDAVGPGGAGAIYRIDGATGTITTFATLPSSADANFAAPNDQPGLGNISYDCDNDEFFVTCMENGRIYRIKSANALNASPAAVLDFFDPGLPDDSQPGFAPFGERLWAVQWHANRVYYSVWANQYDKQTVRSVGLEGGAFVWSSDRHEVVLPLLSGTASGPVSDITFGPGGTMLVAERTMTDATTPGPHKGRVLEYQCATPGSAWAQVNVYSVGAPTPNEAGGGVDWDLAVYDGPSPPASAPPGFTGSRGRAWATADAIHSGAPYPDVVYGLQGLRPGGGAVTTSVVIDSDGDTANPENTSLGDVEVGCPAGVVGVEGGAGIDVRDAKSWVSPIPWREYGTLTFVTPSAGLASVTLFDTGGRAVRSLLQRRWVNAGRHEVVLDGRDDRGERLPSGIYLYRVLLPGTVLSGRIVVVR